MSNTIKVEIHGDWREITLNRPGRLNSFNDEMHRALYTALEQARKEGARALLLTGAGRGFCAGQDLSERDPRSDDKPPNLGQTLTEFYNPLIRLIRSLEFPVICAVNGVAAGAGANIALACDIVLAGRTARFIQSFVKVGLVPDAGGSWLLTRKLGEARAKGLAFTGDTITAQRAEQWGLIWQVFADDALMDEARALTGQLSRGPTRGLAHTKRAIQAASANTLEQQLTLEAELQELCGKTPDYGEGVSAFLQKRSPQFTGKG